MLQWKNKNAPGSPHCCNISCASCSSLRTKFACGIGPLLKLIHVNHYQRSSENIVFPEIQQNIPHVQLKGSCEQMLVVTPALIGSKVTGSF